MSLGERNFKSSLLDPPESGGIPFFFKTSSNEVVALRDNQSECLANVSQSPVSASTAELGTSIASYQQALLVHVFVSLALEACLNKLRPTTLASTGSPQPGLIVTMASISQELHELAKNLNH